MKVNFEQGPIRPPHETKSLLIRVTRNCHWNKCLFCPTYKDKEFNIRSIEEVIEDLHEIKEGENKIRNFAVDKFGSSEITMEVVEEIQRKHPGLSKLALWLYGGAKRVFLQDSDNLIMDTDDLHQIITTIKEFFPGVKGISTYSKSRTIASKSLEELKKLKSAGLTEVHIGLETGHDKLLEYVNKGATSEEHIEGGKKAIEAGLILCEYVILGLGGREWSRDHILDTAKVLNSINPHFIRIRTLGLRDGVPLLQKVTDGNLTLQGDDKILLEERLLLTSLNVDSYVISDHILNLLEEVEGKLPEDKEKMIAKIDEYFELSKEDRDNFCIGRRLGLYGSLKDLKNKSLYKKVEIVKNKLDNQGRVEELFLNNYRGKYNELTVL
ncbi:radical SAM protein [Natranaerofaba carboxydovora]|uniref:radical SAM protein n=1 Tax=Natranaerofaba carboxydovora TaxID=2742683 RepID=UPI001F12AFCE|nr:radical SAM protein [Natranaerofaba carboxydovora]UMZ74784.1 Radical SAM superfamily protein [Natranaerofaba carboxydovora]